MRENDDEATVIVLYFSIFWAIGYVERKSCQLSIWRPTVRASAGIRRRIAALVGVVLVVLVFAALVSAEAKPISIKHDAPWSSISHGRISCLF